jgi:hypothetical protein
MLEAINGSQYTHQRQTEENKLTIQQALHKQADRRLIAHSQPVRVLILVHSPQYYQAKLGISFELAKSRRIAAS